MKLFKVKVVCQVCIEIEIKSIDAWLRFNLLLRTNALFQMWALHNLNLCSFVVGTLWYLCPEAQQKGEMGERGGCLKSKIEGVVCYCYHLSHMSCAQA